MEESIEVTTLTYTDTLDRLYAELNYCYNGVIEILAIVPEKEDRTRLTVITLPSKAICAGMLFTDSSVNIGKFPDNSITIPLLPRTTILHTVLTTLARPASLEYKFLEPQAETFRLIIPDTIESITTKSFLSFSGYGVGSNSLQVNRFLFTLLFSPDTRIYDSGFASFVRDRKFEIIPDKNAMLQQMSVDLEALLQRSSNVASDSRRRDIVYQDTYYLFYLFLVLQKFVFTGILSLDLGEPQQHLMTVVKSSAQPWPYIKDAITVLTAEKEGNYLLDSTKYRTNFAVLLRTYLLNRLVTPSNSQLLGDIKL